MGTPCIGREAFRAIYFGAVSVSRRLGKLKLIWIFFLKIKMEVLNFIELHKTFQTTFNENRHNLGTSPKSEKKKFKPNINYKTEIWNQYWALQKFQNSKPNLIINIAKIMKEKIISKFQILLVAFGWYQKSAAECCARREPSINDITHFLRFLTLPSPLSPILLNRLME